MGSDEPTVFIVDDDEAVRDSLRMLMGTVGLDAECFDSADRFLERHDPGRPGCLLLDLRMPGMSGLDLQRRLVERRSMLPVIFITGHGDVSTAVHAMRAGAVDFVQKPFNEQELLDRIQRTIQQDLRNRALLRARDEIRERIGTLSPRERQVMERVTAGQANKVIAIDLGISERTVEIHRARLMEKMGADSLPHLVRMVLEAAD
jgi:FixJ family two-component response regulator